jgi:hypothetical protein
MPSPRDPWARAIGRALSAEALKLKGTLALWLCLIAPGVVVGLQVLQLLAREAPRVDDPWGAFASAILGLWAFLMLPLFVTLQAALVAGLEHQDRQWKHLLVLPVPRAVHYLAKVVVLLVLLALAMAVLVVLVPLAGSVLRLKPSLGFVGGPDLLPLLAKGALVYACAPLMVAIQAFISLQWRSFTVAVAAGMSATVAGFLIGQSPNWGPWFPWTMGMQPLTRNPSVETVTVVSVLGAIGVTTVAAWAFARRQWAD